MEPRTVEDVVEIGNRYYILASSSLADQRTLVLKHDAAFGVFNAFGDIESMGAKNLGVYHEGTRFLSRLELRVNGRRPLLLNAGVTRDNTRVVVDLTNPDITSEGRVVLPHGTVHLLRSRFLWSAACHERLAVSNFGLAPVEFAVSLRFAADFVDIFEVRGTTRPARGRAMEPVVTKRSVVLGYVGLDGVVRRTVMELDPPPSALTAGEAVFTLRIEPRHCASIHFSARYLEGEVHPAPPPPLSGGGERGLPATHADGAAGLIKAVEEFRGGACRVRSSNENLSQWLRRSGADIRLLCVHLPSGVYPYAGVPWFSCPFGRDGIITALQLLWVKPEIARGVLSYLAANQADRVDPARDAEPGKILHERRVDEMAGLGEVPFGKYYGSVDSTPLFVMLAGAYAATTGDREFAASLWPNVERALAWIDESGDLDGDGFVEYQSRAKKGLTNQGWKDSHDSISHADGSLPAGPIALCEVQGYVYEAKRRAAALARTLGHGEIAGALDSQAEKLRRRFDEAFWRPDLGTYALALDGEKRPCDVRASNAGHCLFTGIALPGRVPGVMSTLLGPAMFTGWGIRTLASVEARYDPMSYHNGSVWPHDNAMIAAGLARYGQRRGALRLFESWLGASTFLELHRLPELFCGFRKHKGRGPTLYPVACNPQAWAAGSVFMLLAACLGLSVDGLHGRVTIRRPALPAGVDHIRLSGLRVGASTMDLLFHREGEDVGVLVEEREGRAEVVVMK